MISGIGLRLTQVNFRRNRFGGMGLRYIRCVGDPGVWTEKSTERDHKHQPDRLAVVFLGKQTTSLEHDQLQPQNARFRTELIMHYSLLIVDDPKHLVAVYHHRRRTTTAFAVILGTPIFSYIYWPSYTNHGIERHQDTRAQLLLESIRHKNYNH